MSSVFRSAVRARRAAVVLVVSALTGLFAAAPPLHAQSATATLNGVVVDETGSVLGAATVTVLNTETRLERTSTADARGRFVVPLLPPGRYTVVSKHAGFAPVEVRDVVLNVNDQIALRVQMKVASLDEAVNIVAEPSRVRTSAAVATVVDRQFVENLPLNGRSFQSLIALTPGVIFVPAGEANTGGQFSVNGQRSSANSFTVDGVSANFGTRPGTFTTPANSGSLPGLTTFGTTQGLLSVDAMEEFKVQTSTYAAEYGRQPGAQISIVSRSGTNQFRGSAFEYFRDDAMDANDWFGNRAGDPKPPSKQHDFGGTLGGPLRLPGYDGRNQTFFFLSYEGLRLRQPRFDLTNVPTLEMRAQAPASLQTLLNAFPLPTGRDLGNGLAEVTAAVSDPSNLNTTSLRVDHAVSGRLRVFARYNDAPSDSGGTTAGSTLAVESTRSLDTRTLTAGATLSLSAHALNDLRVNFSDNGANLAIFPVAAGGSVLPPRSALIPPEYDSPTAQGVVLLGFGGRTSTSIPQVNWADRLITDQQQINIVDTFTYVTGAHQWKAGFDYRRNTPTSGYSAYGLIVSFMSPQAVLAGAPDSVTVRFNRELKPIFTNFSGFVQDTWRASSRLTLDLGLRWEVNPAPREVNGFDTLAVTQVTDLAAMDVAPLSTPAWRTTYDNVGPRVGIAYQVSERPGRETVLRGGFGVFHDTGNERGSANFGNLNYPYSSTRVFSTSTGTGIRYPLQTAAVAPAPAAYDMGLAPPYSNFTATDPDLLLPYTLQWNVAVERSLGRTQTFTLSYVGAAGRRLLQSTQVNVRTAAPGNGNFTTMVIVRNNAASDYHALQAQFQRRLSRGLQLLGSYTWAHAMDDDSSSSTSRVATRGNAAFDVRHVASVAATYDLPTVGRARLVRSLLGGWSLDGRFHAQSALPVDLTSTMFTDPDTGESISVRPDVVPGVPYYVDDPLVPGGRRINRAAFTLAPAGTSGNLGRNVLRGLPIWQVDAALRRQFPLAGSAVLHLRAEAFNLFNRPNFGSIQTNLASPNFGEATAMLNRTLGGLGLLYQMGGPRSVQLAARLTF